MPRKLQTIIIIVVAIAIVIGALAYIASISNKGHNVSSVLGAVPSWAMRFGSPNAPITVVEFFDPLCPYCAVAHYKAGSKIHRLVESGRLQMILIPLPVHGNESLVLINALYCAYRNGSDVLSLLNAWYKALIDYAVNKTENEIVAVVKQLENYKCNEALTMDQFTLTLQDFSNAGVIVRGTPTFIVIKDGHVTVIEGARIEELEQLLE